jgi:hypothetical protein
MIHPILDPDLDPARACARRLVEWLDLVLQDT